MVFHRRDATNGRHRFVITGGCVGMDGTYHLNRVTYMHSLDVRIFPGRTRYNCPVGIFTTSAAFGSSVEDIDVSGMDRFALERVHTPDPSDYWTRINLMEVR